MDTLAAAYLDMGGLDRALPLFVEALEHRASKLGAEHAETLISKNNVAAAHQLGGRIDEAVREFESVLKLRRAKLPVDHPDTLKSMNNLALALREAGRSSEAVAMLEDVLKRRKATLASGHPDTLKTFNDLAAIHLEARRWDAAAALLQECLKLRESKKSSDWRLFQTMSQLGESLAGQHKKSTEAEPLLIRGYEGLKAGETSIPYFKRNEITAAITRLVAFYEGRREPEKALEWRQKLHPTEAPAARPCSEEADLSAEAGSEGSNCAAPTSGAG